MSSANDSHQHASLLRNVTVDTGAALHKEKAPQTMALNGKAQHVSVKVFPTEHPLRCGRKGFLYSPYDRISPIIDSMKEMRRVSNAVEGWSSTGRALQKRQRDDDEESSVYMRRKQPFEKQTFASLLSPDTKSKPIPDVVCKGCSTKNLCHLRVDHGYLICESCGTENGRASSQDDFKDTHDVNDKRTARADFSSRSQDNVDESWVSKLQDASKHRLPKSVQRMTGAAAHLCDRSKDVLDGMSPKVLEKLRNLISAIQTLIRKVNSMPDEIAREIKVIAERTFVASVRHSSCCQHSKSGKCAIDLSNKPPRGLASRFIIYVIEKMCNEGVTGVSKQQLSMLYDEVQHMQALKGRENSSQNESLATLIESIDTNRTKLQSVCSSMSNPIKPTTSKCTQPVPLRSNSTSFEETKTSKVMLIRELLHVVNQKCNFESDVYEAGIVALSNKEFHKTINKKSVLPDSISNEQIAFLILASINASLKSLASVNVPAEAEKRFGMTRVEVLNLSEKIRGNLPKMTRPERDDEEDSFYTF